MYLKIRRILVIYRKTWAVKNFAVDDQVLSANFSGIPFCINTQFVKVFCAKPILCSIPPNFFTLQYNYAFERPTHGSLATLFYQKIAL